MRGHFSGFGGSFGPEVPLKRIPAVLGGSNRPPLSFGQIEFGQGLHHIKQVGLGNAGWFDPGFAIGCQDKTILCRTANAQGFWVIDSF